MAEASEAAIMRRAREFAEADGFAWELEFKGHTTPYEPIKPQPYLSPERRQQYVDRARAEASKEI